MAIAGTVAVHLRLKSPAGRQRSVAVRWLKQVIPSAARPAAVTDVAAAVEGRFRHRAAPEGPRLSAGCREASSRLRGVRSTFRGCWVTQTRGAVVVSCTGEGVRSRVPASLRGFNPSAGPGCLRTPELTKYLDFPYCCFDALPPEAIPFLPSAVSTKFHVHRILFDYFCTSVDLWSCFFLPKKLLQPSVPVLPVSTPAHSSLSLFASECFGS